MSRLTRRRALGCTGGAMAALWRGSALAQTPVDLQLALAVDASGSVDQRRFNLQKQGYVAAFQNPRVLAAIRSGPYQSIAVTMFQWTGPRLQFEVIPWMVIRDEASALDVSRAIDAVPRRIFGGGTSISGAIDFGVTRFARGELESDRKVIDVSGDGANNGGRPVTIAYGSDGKASATTRSPWASPSTDFRSSPSSHGWRSITGKKSSAGPALSWSRRRISRASATP